MEMFNIGIFDSKLDDKCLELDKYLSSQSHYGNIAIKCGQYIELGQINNFHVIFLHRNDYQPNNSYFTTIRNQCSTTCHLYWTSSVASNVDQNKIKALLSKDGYEERGVPVDLSGFESYQSLKWTEAITAWLTKINSSSKDHPPILPPFPIGILCQQTDFSSFFIPLICMDLLIQGYLAIHSSDSKWSVLRKGTLGLLSEEAIQSAKAKTLSNALFPPSSSSNSEYWFSSVPREAVKPFPLPFASDSDKLLMQTGIEAKDREAQKQFKNIIFSDESQICAQEISNSLQNGNNLPAMTGGALRLCWDLLIGEGTAHGFTVSSSDGITAEGLCSLFEKAHDELMFVTNNVGE